MPPHIKRRRFYDIIVKKNADADAMKPSSLVASRVGDVRN